MGHLFIINPLAGQGADNLFSTHPATHNRIRALQGFAQKARPRGFCVGAGTTRARPMGSGDGSGGRSTARQARTVGPVIAI